MAIVLQNPEFARLYGQAALMQGQAERAVVQARLNAEKEMAVFNQNLQMERMKFSNLMDFEAEKRAKLWDIEKMEMRSRIDFQEDEKKRLQRLNEYDLGIKYIREADAKGDLPPGMKEKAEFDLTMEKLYNAPGVNMPQPKTEKEIFTEAKKQQVLGALTTKSPVSPMGLPLPTLTKKEDRESYITNELGPNWRQLLPEAISLVEGTKSTIKAPAKPSSLPVDAFYENGYWKVVRNGEKLRWVE